jgi:hypothetical protein
MTTENNLMAVLGYGADDLAENRAGRLSAAQRERLSRSARRALLIGVLIVVAIGLAAALFIYLGSVNGSVILNIVGLALTVINAVIVVVIAQNRGRTGADLRAGTVTALTGRLTRTVRVQNRLVTYVLKVNDEEVQVSRALFAAFSDGGRYRLYRTPASKTLVGAEVLR